MQNATFAKMIQNVYGQKKEMVGEYKLQRTCNSVFLYAHYKPGHTDFVFAIRGTIPTRHDDVQACALLVVNHLATAERYKRDKNFIETCIREGIEGTHGVVHITFTGHSLGGAICDQLIADGIAHHAVSFNPAIQPKDLHNSGNTRYYKSGDPLYMLMGRFASHIHVTHSNYHFIDIDWFSVLKLYSEHQISQFTNKYSHA